MCTSISHPDYRKTSNIIHTFYHKIAWKVRVRIIHRSSFFCSFIWVWTTVENVKITDRNTGARRWCCVDVIINEWIGLRRTKAAQSLQFMLMLAAFDWPSALLSSSCVRPGRHSRDRWGGETCELNVTQWLTAPQWGRSRPYARASMSDMA